MTHKATYNSRYDDLTARILGGDCVAVVGSGLSANHYPSWDVLIGKLCSACGIPFDAQRRLRDTELLALAEMARSNRDIYIDVLSREFQHRSFIPGAYFSLARSPFSSFINLNYDCFLINACAKLKQSVYTVYPGSILSATNNCQKHVAHIHGIIKDIPDDIDNIILTHAQYANAYGDPNLTSYLQQTFLCNNVCFVGCSLRDPGLRRIIAKCKQVYRKLNADLHGDAKKWYALFPADEKPPRGIDRAGIEIVRYDNSVGDFSGLEHILDQWAGVSGPRQRDSFKTSLTLVADPREAAL